MLVPFKKSLIFRYCESIGATLQKEKKGSIFITSSLIRVLRELTERIAESSQPGFSEKSSWFGGKKSTRGEYFWKTLEANLTKFVAGDEASEDSSSTTNVKNPLDVHDPRFGRIASDTSLNRMASLPNLRARATTPVHEQFTQDTLRAPGPHSRYTAATSESRYTPVARYEQAPLPPMQEYDTGRSGDTSGSGFETPEFPNRGYSPYVPPAQLQAPAQVPDRGYSPYVPPIHSQSQPQLPDRIYSPYVPPAPAPPPEARVEGRERPQEPEEPEDTTVRQRQEMEESEKASKEKDKEKETEKNRKCIRN